VDNPSGKLSASVLIAVTGSLSCGAAADPST
jgi:hypothetical protein